MWWPRKQNITCWYKAQHRRGCDFYDSKGSVKLDYVLLNGPGNRKGTWKVFLKRFPVAFGCSPSDQTWAHHLRKKKESLALFSPSSRQDVRRCFHLLNISKYYKERLEAGMPNQGKGEPSFLCEQPIIHIKRIGVAFSAHGILVPQFGSWRTCSSQYYLYSKTADQKERVGDGRLTGKELQREALGSNQQKKIHPIFFMKASKYSTSKKKFGNPSMTWNTDALTITAYEGSGFTGVG